MLCAWCPINAGRHAVGRCRIHIAHPATPCYARNARNGSCGISCYSVFRNCLRQENRNMSIMDTAQYPYGADGSAADKAELFDVFFDGRSPDCCPCFMCGKNVGSVFVCWDGSDAKIILHPSCAQELAAHLNKDGVLAVEKQVDSLGVRRKNRMVRTGQELVKVGQELVRDGQALVRTAQDMINQETTGQARVRRQ